MKYKLLKELPFIKIGEVFGTGCWVGGGYGVDMGETLYDGGGRSSNGVKCFEKHENELLEHLIINKEWIEKIPCYAEEAIKLYDEKYIDAKKLIAYIKNY